MRALSHVLTTGEMNLQPFENATLIPAIDEDLTKQDTLEEAQNKWIDTHFYRLNVYLRDSKTVHYTQVVKVGIADLFSGIGGCLGLWIGFSVITLIEICLFFGRFLAVFSKGKSAIVEMCKSFGRTFKVSGNEKCKVQQIHVSSGEKFKEATVKASKIPPKVHSWSQ